ncbi:Major centromere autoantigen B, partial [Dictyocoela muelleri]
KGLVVKEKYLKSKALKIADSLMISNFKCSSGYIEKFKKRHNLVSRRHTSCRTLPPNAKSLAHDFITTALDLIKKNSIKPKNILNFDQVPRYFEQENNKTITFKREKKVKLAKASSSHSRVHLLQ